MFVTDHHCMHLWLNWIKTFLITGLVGLKMNSHSGNLSNLLKVTMPQLKVREIIQIIIQLYHLL